MSDTFTPQPNDQMVEPELGDEDLNAWLDSLNDQTVDLPSLLTQPARMPQAQEGEDDPDDEQEPDPNATDPDGTQDPQEDQGVEGVDYFTVNGNRFDRADIERLYNFDQFMRSDPAAAQRVAAALQSPPQPGQPPIPNQATPPTGTGQQEPTVDEWQEPTPPEGLDLEDPNTKFMWDSMVTLQKSQWETVQQINQERAQRAADLRQSQARQAQVDMQTALSTFRQQYPGLNDDDVASIRQDAIPFIEGFMRQLDAPEALRRSMEVAAYANSDMRQKLELSTPAPTAKQQSTRRKNKLGSIAGSPRSAPRTEPRTHFTNDKDAVQAFAEGIAESLAGR